MAASPRPTIKSVVLEYVERNRPAVVDGDVLTSIRREVVRVIRPEKAPAESYLMEIIHGTDIEIDRRLGGIPVDLRHRVRTSTLEGARETLIAMSSEFERATDAVRAEDVRRAVRRAKDNLRLVLSRNLAPEKRSVKEEILRWMLVWLENPGLFEAWVTVRGDIPGPEENRA